MFSAATALDTPAGACGLAWSGAGLTRVRPFEDGLACAAARVSKQGAVLVPGPEVPPHIAAVIAALRAFLSGVPTAFDDVTLDFSGLSDFEAALYGALRAVPWG